MSFVRAPLLIVEQRFKMLVVRLRVFAVRHPKFGVVFLAGKETTACSYRFIK